MSVTTINVNRQGYIDGSGGSNFATARQTGATAVDSPSTNVGIAFRYFFSSGRGGGTHDFFRTYLHFATSGLSGIIPSGTTAVLNIRGSGFGGGDFIVVKSGAFGGNGGTALNVFSDFFTNLDYTTDYSAEISSWSTTGNNAINLNSDAINDIYSSTHFTIALINYTHDYSNSAATSNTTLNNGIAFGTTITLVVTEPGASGPANVGFVNKVAAANIGFMNTVAYGGIETINTVS